MGIKYPFGDSPQYPPRDWTCPVCKKYHSKPHFAFPGQIDYSKQPQEVGRVKFNREGSDQMCDGIKYDTPTSSETGDILTDDKHNSPLFCPHCGWEETLLYIIKTSSQVKKKRKIWP